MQKMSFGVESLKLKAEAKKGSLGSLTSLISNLPVKGGTGKSQKDGQKPKRVSNKTKQKVAGSEIKLLRAVHEHPAFKADPFAAIQEHLKNTLNVPSNEKPPTSMST